jgi:hypothetical protein
VNGQRYISDELTHFVGGYLSDDRERQFALLVRILGAGAIIPSPWFCG